MGLLDFSRNLSKAAKILFVVDDCKADERKCTVSNRCVKYYKRCRELCSLFFVQTQLKLPLRGRIYGDIQLLYDCFTAESKCHSYKNFWCPHSGECIYPSLKCDGRKHCRDGFDEEGCGLSDLTFSCKENIF